MTYALDTNIIIHLLNHSANVLENRKKTMTPGNTIIIPPFVNYEMRRGFLYRQAPVKEEAYQFLCSRYPVGEMDADAWERAAVLYADLRHAGRTIEDADILIAAFCIVGNYTLVTHNIRHFEGIDGLQIEDWAQ